MNVFGLTPIDASLAAFGLNFSQNLIEVIFIKTLLGTLAFVCGLLLSVWESAKKSDFKHFFIFLFIACLILMLGILPNKQEYSIKSVTEVFNQSSSISTDSLKKGQSVSVQMPLLLTALAKAVDVISITVISTIDASLNNYVSFLRNPFGLQKLSLQSNHTINSLILDPGLKEDVDDFGYTHYLPSLIMYESQQQMNDLSPVWAGDKRIITYYSENGKKKWVDLKDRLSALLGSQSHWRSIYEILNQFKSLTQDEFLDQVIAATMSGQYSPRHNFWLTISENIHMFSPFVQGWANFCLYASFPFVLLVLLISHRVMVVLYFLETFIWIKSWMLGSAISYYISLFAARIQSQTSQDIMWFWNCPYFVAISAILLILMPIFTFIGIHQLFQFIGQRS